MKLAHSLLLIVCVLKLLQQTCSFQFASLKVSPTSTTINTVTQYAITYDRTQDDNFIGTAYNSIAILPSDTVTVTFPNTYSLTSVNCTVSVNGNIPLTPTSCTVSGQKVIATGVVSTNTYISSLVFYISNILNPSPAITTAEFYGTIGSDTSGTGIFSSTVVLTASTFINCYITFSPNTVNSTSAMILTLVPQNAIPSGGSVTVQFPTNRRWTNDISTTNFIPINSAMSCSSQSSNVISSFLCTGSPVQASVTANSIFSSSVSSSFSFSINNLISPPTGQPSDPISVTSYINGNAIDSCTAYVSNLVPKTFTSLSIVNANGTPIYINRQYSLRFIMIISDTVAQNDTMTVTIPSPSSLTLSISNISSNFSILPNLTTYDTGSGILNLTMQNQGRTFSVGTYIVLTIGLYTAPATIEPTGNFVVSIYRNGYVKMQGTATIIAQPGSLTSTVNILSAYVNANTSYTFSIVTNDAISSSGKIKIILPSAINILATSTSCATVSAANMAIYPYCSYNTVQNSVTLSNINSSSSSISPTTITITINGIKNPSSTAQTGLFTVNTYNNNNDSSLVATGTIPGITAIVTTIDSSKVVITPSSYVVNAQGVTYTVQLTVSNPIPAGGYFSIYFPNQITVPTASLAGQCSISLNNSAFTSTACTGVANSTGTLVTFSNPLPSTAATLNTVIAARISNIIGNPSSTKPTSSLGLYTYDATSSIANIQSAITVQMTAPGTFSTISISKASTKNYDVTTYTFTITQRSYMAGSSILTIALPSTVSVLAGYSCSISAPLTASLNCTYSSPTIVIVLPSTPISANTAFSISITNIRNPPSYAPLGTFLFTTALPSPSTYIYSNSTHNSLLTNTISTPFSSLSASFSPAMYGSPTSLKLSFQPSSSNALPSSLRITFAMTFTINTLSCNSFVNFIGTCSVLYNHTLQIQCSNVSNSIMSFSVTGITSPLSAVSDYSQFISFDSNGYEIDSSNNYILFTVDCAMPCRTCLPSNTSTCLSCYSNTAIRQQIYYDSLTNYCYSKCPDGKYNTLSTNSTYICALCDTNCLTCTSYPTFCLTCNSSSNYKYLYINTTDSTQICVAVCPSQMYPQTSLSVVTCKPCIPPCKNCTTNTSCLSCLPTYYYYLNQCPTSCPLGITIANNGSNNCDYCDANCLTCSNIVTNCMSCNSSLLLYNGQCRTSCPAGLVPVNGTCGSCDTSCLTCTGDMFNCTSCNISSALPYLYSNTCRATCPSYYYQNIANGTCSSCAAISPTIYCNNCSSATTCLSCNIPYVLHLSKCLNYTPDGYVNISGVAQPCAGDCKTCNNTNTTCTSCINYNLLNNSCIVNCINGTVAMNHVCVPCTSPCKTCTVNATQCTSCVTNISPSVYLSNYRCLQVCPDGTYPTQVNYTCLPCTGTCLYCTTATTCTSCITNYNYINGTCVSLCPNGYVGISQLCQPCINNCSTCQNTTYTCTSCLNNTYLLQATHTCVASCGTGLFIDYLNKLCVFCTPPCKTCVSTADNCLSCTTGLLLYNNQCFDVCPDKYYAQTGQCYPCAANCSSCLSLNNCTACISTLVQYNGYCISQCPTTHAVVVSSVCTKCSTQNCYQCTSANYCYSCLNSYSLLNGLCLVNCPTGYQTNGTHCNDVIVQTMTSNTSFPVPFSIAGIVIIIACLMSKLQYSHTFMQGAIFSLLAIIQWAALVYFLFQYYKQSWLQSPLPFIVGIAALAYLYLMNILALFIQNYTLLYDPAFNLWLKSKSHKVTTILANIVSVIISHKFRNFIFSKLFNFSILCANLQSITKFRIINIFSFLSLLHSAAAIFASAAAIKSSTPYTQLYYACIDVIAVTAVNVIMAFLNILKTKDFFYESTNDGFQLKKRITGDDQYYQSKIQPTGKGKEDEEGYMSNVFRNQAGTGVTYKPFNRDDHNYKDFSYGSLMDQNIDISVQANQHVDDQQIMRNTDNENQQFSLQMPRGDQLLYNTSKLSRGKISIEDAPMQGKSLQIPNQKIYNKDMILNGKENGALRTVFYREIPIQISSQDIKKQVSQQLSKQKEGSKVKLNNKRSIYDSTKQQNQNILYKPNSPKKQPIQQLVQYKEDENKKHVAVGNLTPIQLQQEIEKKVQKLKQANQEKQKQKNKNNFNQFQQQIQQQYPNTNVIFDDNQNKQQDNQIQLNASQKDELLLPQDKIQQYEKQLKNKIQQNERELNRMKEKIQQKEKINQLLKDNQDRENQSKQIGKIYRKKISIEDGQNDKQMQQSGQQNIDDIIEEHPEKLIFEEEEQNKQPQQQQINNERNQTLQPQQSQIQKQGYISSGQQKSTKIQSSIPAREKNKKQFVNSNEIDNQIEKSQDEDSVGIHIKPMGPNSNHLSDDVDSGLFSKNKKNRQAGQYSQREDGQKNERYDKQESQNTNQFRASVPAKPRTAFDSKRQNANINKSSQIQGVKKFQFQNSQKNISESGQQQLPFGMRQVHHLIAPFQTDKEQTEFRFTQVKASSPQKILIPKQHSTIPARPGNSSLPKKKIANKSPLSTQKIRNPIQAQYGPPDRDDQPSLQQADTQYISMPKRGTLKQSQVFREEDDDLKKYYEQNKNKNSRDKSKKKSQANLIETSKIYLQRPDTGKWK